MLTPLLAVTVGGALLAGGCADGNEREDRPEPSHAASTVTAAAAGTMIGNTVTGRIETLQGEPLRVRSDPYGPEIGEYRDGSTVEIICQAWGPDAPGEPAAYGKRPFDDNTWLQLGDPTSGQPFSPPRWVPVLPVFADGPVPSCPPLPK